MATIGGSQFYLWHYFREPVAIAQDAKHRTASVISRRGTPIKTWWTEVDDGVFAECVAFKQEDGDASYAAVGFSASCAPDQACQLQLFDLRADLDRPKWSWRIRPEDLPDEVVASGISADQFSPANVWICDVFAESQWPATNEVVCQFSHNTGSWRALCVFAADGRLLYSIWNDGGIHACHWMPGPGLLIVAAENWTKYPHERGCDRAGPGTEMLVVFALRPELGRVEPRVLDVEQPGSTSDLSWYKWLSVCPLPKFMWGWQLTGLRDGDTRSFVDLSLKIGTVPPCAVSWRLDPNGERVPGSIVATSYIMAKRQPENADLPPLEDLDLQENPPEAH